MKKFSIKNMSVRSKILTFTTLMLLFMFIIAGVGLFAAIRINKESDDRYNDYAMSQLYLSEAFNDFANIKVHVRNILFLYYDDPVNLRTQQTDISNYRAATLQYLQMFENELDKLPAGIRTQYQKVKDSINNWLTSMDSQLAMADAGKLDEAIEELMGNGTTLSAQAESDLNTLRSLLNTESNAEDDKLDRELTILIALIIVVAVVAVLIGSVYAVFLTKVIMDPVRRLTKAAESLARGDVNVDCTKLYDDELGQLMDGFAQMVNNIREQANIANSIAGGDLTISVVPKSDKDVLGLSLQKLVNDNDEILGNVKESTQQVTVGAEQVATASQSLAQGATEQASALEQVTASMDEIAERTKTNASEANQADKLVHNVKKMAVSGNEQMKNMIVAMNDINQSSEMISKIIKVINDISFQTNILALNAAVEAARAGVHGKGFTVVAEQVRDLAGKSASAANEIAEMIEDSIRKVGIGTKIAEETGKSLDEILNSIDQVVELIATIATASNTQATAVSQVDQALGQVSQVVQTNSATSEQCAAASEELSNQAAALRSLMANYKLTGGSGQSGMSMSSRFKGSSYSSSDDYNEQIISLNGEFGKY